MMSDVKVAPQKSTSSREREKKNGDHCAGAYKTRDRGVSSSDFIFFSRLHAGREGYALVQ